MGIFNKKEIREYEEEILRQTEPYEYYIRKTEGSQRDPLMHKLRSDPVGTAGNGNRSKRIPGRETQYKPDSELSERFDGYRVYELKDHYLFLMEEAVPEWNVIERSLNGEEELVYFDHDHITGNKRHTPFFKPEWSFDTFMSFNFLRECFALSKELLGKKSITEGLEGISDVWELIYLCVKCGAGIVHVGETACHIRTEETEEEEVYREYCRDQSSLSRQRIGDKIRKAEGYPADRGGKLFSVSVIIPSKDHSGILEKCLRSIAVKTSFNIVRLEVIIVDNGSTEAEKDKIITIINNICNETKDRARSAGSDFDIRYIYEPSEFNFSAMSDRGVREARYEYLLFMNNDIELRDKGAIEKLCAYAALKDAGAVGLKLYYPDSTLIQHDGITDLDCGPSHKLSGHDDRHVFYFGINRFNRNVLAVTGACLMIGKEKYFNIGGFDVKMKVSYNDVELCLKCLKKGYRNILLNDTVMYHHESLMRGKDNDPQNGERNEGYKRLTAERDILYRSNEWLKKEGDPYYSKRLVSDTLDYFVNVLPEYERRSSRSSVRELKQREISRLNRKKTRQDKHLRLNVEKTSFETGMGDERTDYYLIEGWFIDDKRDNSRFERSLVLLSDDGGLELGLFPKYRRDVGEVHKKAKRALLAGFVCKLPAAFIKKGKKYEAVFVMKTKGRNNARCAVWDRAVL